MTAGRTMVNGTPDSLWGVWTLQFLFIFSTLLFVYRLLDQEFGLYAALAGVIVLTSGLLTILEKGNVTEEYALGFQALCFWLFLRAWRKDFPLRDSFWIGVLGALIQRGITGRGMEVQSALYENNVFLMGQHMLQFAVTGKHPAPMPARDNPWSVYDVFTVKDGEQIFLAAVSDAQWLTFCDALGFADLKAEPA